MGIGVVYLWLWELYIRKWRCRESPVIRPGVLIATLPIYLLLPPAPGSARPSRQHRKHTEKERSWSSKPRAEGRIVAITGSVKMSILCHLRLSYLQIWVLVNFLLQNFTSMKWWDFKVESLASRWVLMCSSHLNVLSCPPMHKSLQPVICTVQLSVTEIKVRYFKTFLW